MRVLIVEDSELMGKGLEALLLSQGHQVLWIVGIRSLIGERFVGIAPNKRPCTFDPNSFQVAFVDGQIYGIADKNTEGKKPGELFCGNLGPGVVKALAARGVACAGISTDPKLNTEMLENGAKVAHNKAAMFVALVNDLLTAQQIPTLDAPALQTLGEFVANCSGADSKPLRERADAFLMPFLKSEC